MDKFKEISEKYYLKELLFIFAISAFLFFLFYGKQDVYLVDVGREAYIPWQMLKGQLLYKDIFNVYGPLGYQINAILYYIFGIHLNTLYFAGFFNSLIILYSVFFISKLFVDKKIALTLTALVLGACVYSNSLFFNFIFVYSYSAVYALSGFLLSLYFALKFIRDKKTYALILAFLFAGFSFACKIENAPYFCFLFACLPFFAKRDWKKYLYAAAAFFTFPALSFGTLLVQGVSLNDFTHAAVLIKRLVEAKATTFFYANYGLYFNKAIFFRVINYFGKLILYILLPSATVFALNFIKAKYVQNNFIKGFINFFIFAFMTGFVLKNLRFFEANNHNMFCWLGIACLVILAGFVVRFCLTGATTKTKTAISTTDLMYTFLLTSAICVSFKGLFAITITCYGTFTVTALIIPFVIFLTKYFLPSEPMENAPFQEILAKYTPKVSENIKIAFVNTIIILCYTATAACLFANIDRITTGNLYTIKTPNGLMSIRSVYPDQNVLLDYIIKNTPQNARIVTVPEGVTINFLTQRDSHNKYYYLIPGNVEVFGEENILNDFKQNPPDYFITQDLSYSCYGVDDFCSYAGKICDFIRQNYTQQIGVKGTIDMYLYKRK